MEETLPEKNEKSFTRNLESFSALHPSTVWGYREEELNTL